MPDLKRKVRSFLFSLSAISVFFSLKSLHAIDTESKLARRQFRSGAATNPVQSDDGYV